MQLDVANRACTFWEGESVDDTIAAVGRVIHAHKRPIKQLLWGPSGNNIRHKSVLELRNIILECKFLFFQSL